MLFDTVLVWSKEHNVNTIYLGNALFFAQRIVFMGNMDFEKSQGEICLHIASRWIVTKNSISLTYKILFFFANLLMVNLLSSPAVKR